MSFMAEATLPEIGLVNEFDSVRVFVNDIRVRPKASRDGIDANLTVTVNDITLDRINDGTAERWNVPKYRILSIESRYKHEFSVPCKISGFGTKK